MTPPIRSCRCGACVVHCARARSTILGGVRTCGVCIHGACLSIAASCAGTPRARDGARGRRGDAALLMGHRRRMQPAGRGALRLVGGEVFPRAGALPAGPRPPRAASKWHRPVFRPGSGRAGAGRRRRRRRVSTHGAWYSLGAVPRLWVMSLGPSTHTRPNIGFTISVSQIY